MSYADPNTSAEDLDIMLLEFAGERLLSQARRTSEGACIRKDLVRLKRIQGLLANIAHDLNQPRTVISLQIDVLEGKTVLNDEEVIAPPVQPSLQGINVNGSAVGIRTGEGQ